MGREQTDFGADAVVGGGELPEIDVEALNRSRERIRDVVAENNTREQYRYCAGTATIVDVPDDLDETESSEFTFELLLPVDGRTEVSFNADSISHITRMEGLLRTAGGSVDPVDALYQEVPVTVNHIGVWHVICEPLPDEYPTPEQDAPWALSLNAEQLDLDLNGIVAIPLVILWVVAVSAVLQFEPQSIGWLVGGLLVLAAGAALAGLPIYAASKSFSPLTKMINTRF